MQIKKVVALVELVNPSGKRTTRVIEVCDEPPPVEGYPKLINVDFSKIHERVIEKIGFAENIEKEKIIKLEPLVKKITVITLENQAIVIF